MKYAELKDLTAEELRQKEAGLQEELFKLRLRQATSQVENPMRIRQLRRDIARIRTAQRALTGRSRAREGRRMAEERGRRQTTVGTVVSDKMQKTVVVEIARLVRHLGYSRMVSRKTRVKAHDEQDACHVGDTVRLMETRPLSKDKRWRVVEVLQKAV